MSKPKDSSERPMGVQPAPLARCFPMQPPMPLATVPPMGPPAPAPEPSRDAAVKAAKAKITRRKSLAKQRAQQTE